MFISISWFRYLVRELNNVMTHTKEDFLDANIRWGPVPGMSSSEEQKENLDSYFLDDEDDEDGEYVNADENYEEEKDPGDASSPRPH